jgi:hypothetical protein
MSNKTTKKERLVYKVVLGRVCSILLEQGHGRMLTPQAANSMIQVRWTSTDADPLQGHKDI